MTDESLHLLGRRFVMRAKRPWQWSRPQDLFIRVQENTRTGATTVTTMGGAQSVSVPAWTTGDFEDVTGSAALYPGDLIYAHIRTSQGRGTLAIQARSARKVRGKPVEELIIRIAGTVEHRITKHRTNQRTSVLQRVWEDDKYRHFDVKM
jgi:hypothetical protein